MSNNLRKRVFSNTGFNVFKSFYITGRLSDAFIQSDLRYIYSSGPLNILRVRGQQCCSGTLTWDTGQQGLKPPTLRFPVPLRHDDPISDSPTSADHPWCVTLPPEYNCKSDASASETLFPCFMSLFPHGDINSRLTNASVVGPIWMQLFLVRTGGV